MKLRKWLVTAFTLGLLACAPSALAQCACQGQLDYPDGQQDCQRECGGYVPSPGYIDEPSYPCWGEFAEYCPQTEQVQEPQEEPARAADSQEEPACGVNYEPCYSDGDSDREPPQVFDDRNLNDDAVFCPPLNDTCRPDAGGPLTHDAARHL